MSETEHTPTPWDWSLRKRRREAARKTSHNPLVEQRDALLAACKALVAAHEKYGPCRYRDCFACRRGKAAIAQATPTPDNPSAPAASPT